MLTKGLPGEPCFRSRRMNSFVVPPLGGLDTKET